MSNNDTRIRKILKELRANRDAFVHNSIVQISRHDDLRDTFLLQDYVACTSLGGGTEISAYKARKIIKEMLEGWSDTMTAT